MRVSAFLILIINIFSGNIFCAFPAYFMGEKPPDCEPKVFKLGIVSSKTGHEFSCAFSPDGREFYFNRGLKILRMDFKSGAWSDSSEVQFTGGYNAHEPHITLDNNWIYFGSWMPQPGKEYTDRTYGIWRCKRTSRGVWGQSQYVGLGGRFTSDRLGNYFLTDYSRPTKWIGITRIHIEKGIIVNYSPLRGGMENPTPSHKQGRHPCISPDGDYILFDAYLNNEDETPSLFVCFRENGSWSQAYQLFNNVDMKGDAIASLSPDGKYIFFTRDSDIYWVSSRIVLQAKSHFISHK